MKFCRYFYNTWLVKYDVDEWAVNGRLARTNNAMEGFNNLIKKKFRINPSAYSFISSVHALASHCLTLYLSDLRQPRAIIDRSLLSAPLNDAMKQLRNDGSVRNFLVKMANI